MKFYQEVTADWSVDISNHIYLLNDSRDRMRGYVPSGTDKLILFKNALPFDVRRRKIKQVENRWNWVDDSVSSEKTWKVSGSRGDIYTVTETETGLTCSCSGFKFRGQCRHIKTMKDVAS
jgi:hypothetical protein